jgi:hypothetical protein
MLSPKELLIAAPLVPSAPVLVTWWLPWERWIPWAKLKAVLGPYLVYVSFAAWYFSFGWFVVPISFLSGVALSTWAIVDAINT